MWVLSFVAFLLYSTVVFIAGMVLHQWLAASRRNKQAQWKPLNKRSGRIIQ